MSSPSNIHDRLPPEALRWVARAVGAGATIESFAPLAGATSYRRQTNQVNPHGRRVEVVGPLR